MNRIKDFVCKKFGLLDPSRLIISLKRDGQLFYVESLEKEMQFRKVQDGSPFAVDLNFPISGFDDPLIEINIRMI